MAVGHLKFVADLIQSDKRLSNDARLLIWHGSLPNGRGGRRWDIDVGLFVDVETPADLCNAGTRLGTAVRKAGGPLAWRNDVHYDGMPMWEAHMHLDPSPDAAPHLGMHLYRMSALGEIKRSPTWSLPREPEDSFFRILESWKRYSFFQRHWIYEGRALFDPDGVFQQLVALHRPPAAWFVDEFRAVLKACLVSYVNQPRGACTIARSRDWALELVALYAYTLEGVPMGRKARFSGDIVFFRKPRAAMLLQAVIDNDLGAASSRLTTDFE